MILWQFDMVLCRLNTFLQLGEQYLLLCQYVWNVLLHVIHWMSIILLRGLWISPHFFFLSFVVSIEQFWQNFVWKFLIIIVHLHLTHFASFSTKSCLYIISSPPQIRECHSFHRMILRSDIVGSQTHHSRLVSSHSPCRLVRDHVLLSRQAFYSLDVLHLHPSSIVF